MTAVTAGVTVECHYLSTPDGVFTTGGSGGKLRLVGQGRMIEAMAGRNALNDAAGLRDALQFLIDEAERRPEMQEAAYRRAVDQFDIRRMMRQNAEFVLGKAP